MKILDLINVGSKVKVNPDLSIDRLSSSTLEIIKQDSEYLVKDFKITDGKGIGVIIELVNGQEEWFFDSEIEIYDDEGIKVNLSPSENKNTNSFLNNLNNLVYRLRKSPKELLNPLNFLAWLVYSVKDTI